MKLEPVRVLTWLYSNWLPTSEIRLTIDFRPTLFNMSATSFLRHQKPPEGTSKDLNTIANEHNHHNPTQGAVCFTCFSSLPSKTLTIHFQWEGWIKCFIQMFYSKITRMLQKTCINVMKKSGINCNTRTGIEGVADIMGENT